MKNYHRTIWRGWKKAANYNDTCAAVVHCYARDLFEPAVLLRKHHLHKFHSYDHISTCCWLCWVLSCPFEATTQWPPQTLFRSPSSSSPWQVCSWSSWLLQWSTAASVATARTILTSTWPNAQSSPRCASPRRRPLTTRCWSAASNMVIWIVNLIFLTFHVSNLIYLILLRRKFFHDLWSKRAFLLHDLPDHSWWPVCHLLRRGRLQLPGELLGPRAAQVQVFRLHVRIALVRLAGSHADRRFLQVHLVVDVVHISFSWMILYANNHFVFYKMCLTHFTLQHTRDHMIALL